MPSGVVHRAACVDSGSIYHRRRDLFTWSSIQNRSYSIDLHKNAWPNTTGNIRQKINDHMTLNIAQYYITMFLKPLNDSANHIVGNLDGIIIRFRKSCSSIWSYVCWLGLQRIRNLLDNGIAPPWSSHRFGPYAIRIQTIDSLYAQNTPTKLKSNGQG